MPDAAFAVGSRQWAARAVPAIVLLLGLFVVAQARGADRIGERQRAVEHGLLPSAVLADAPLPSLALRDRMAHYRVPGVSLAVVHDGHVEWAAAYGVLRSGGTERVTPSSLFQAASISKPIAALVALRLVEQGLLDLDRDVNEDLRTWKVPDNEYTEEQPVTLRHLLSHGAGTTVSGFPGYRRGEAIPSTVDVLDGRGNTPPVRVTAVPGAEFRYSGGGSTILQLLIEDATGEPFDTTLERLVLDPLGMYRSSAAQPLPDRLHGDAAAGHDAGGAPVAGQWRVYPELCAAGVWSTPTDLARFALGVRAAFRGDKDAILSRSLGREMLTLQNEVYGLGPGVLRSGDAFWFAHSGGNAGYRAYLLLYPDSGDGLAVMTNGDGGRALNFEIIRAVSRVYDWPAHKPEVRRPVELSPDEFERWTGSYRFADSPGAPIVRVEFSGQHVELVQPMDDSAPRRRLVPTSTTEFIEARTGRIVSFATDSSGVEIVIDGRTATRLSGDGELRPR